MTMIPCDSHIKHFYVLSIIDIFRFFFFIKKDMKLRKQKILNDVSFGSSFNSLGKAVCVLLQRPRPNLELPIETKDPTPERFFTELHVVTRTSVQTACLVLTCF